MKKKSVVIFLCALIILLVGTVYFFHFTFNGQRVLYDIFGGNNLHLVSNDKELYWFYVQHRNDPNAPIFRRIENVFVEFNPDFILVEGGNDTFVGNRSEAIRGGESAFAAYLAKEKRITVENIEPPFERQIAYLQEKYPANDILAMYLVRQISSIQWADDNSEWDFEKFLLNETHFLKENGLDYSGETLEDILATINAFLPESINADNWRDVDIKKMNRVYAKESGVLFPIYRDVTEFRNIYLVELIKEKKNIYGRILIIMGGGHLEETKEQLNELYFSSGS